MPVHTHIHTYIHVVRVRRSGEPCRFVHSRRLTKRPVDLPDDGAVQLRLGELLVVVGVVPTVWHREQY